MYCGMYPYPQFSLQSADFSISLSELLLNPSTPSIHLCLQQQQYDTSVQNPSLLPVLNSPAVVEVGTALQPAAHLWKYFGSTHRNNRGNHCH